MSVPPLPSSAPPRARLGLQILFYYSLTNLPVTMAIFPVAVYVPKFYAADMGVPLALVGAILLSVRIVDIFTDPVMGFISDRTRSRFGRRRPWIFLGMPLMTLSIYMVFAPPAGAGAAHLFVWLLLLSFATTLILIPYLAWGAELSSDYNERSRVTGARAMSGVVGNLSAQLIPLVALVCCGIGKSAAVLQMIGVAALILIPTCVMLTLARTPEPKLATQSQLPVLKGLKLMVTNKPFLQLVLAFMIGQIGLNITTPLYIFFITSVLGAEAQAPYMLGLFFVSNMAAIPFWVWLAGKVGKHRAYLASFCLIGIAHPFYLLLGPGDFWWMAPITVAVGFSAGGFAMLPESMKADVIDLDTVASGQDRAALFFSAWSFAQKATASVGVFIATVGLSLFGFDPKPGAVNGPDELFALRFLFSSFPSLFFIAGALVVWNYPITEARHAEIRAELESRRKLAGSQ